MSIPPVSPPQQPQPLPILGQTASQPSPTPFTRQLAQRAPSTSLALPTFAGNCPILIEPSWTAPGHTTSRATPTVPARARSNDGNERLWTCGRTQGRSLKAIFVMGLVRQGVVEPTVLRAQVPDPAGTRGARGGSAEPGTGVSVLVSSRRLRVVSGVLPRIETTKPHGGDKGA